MNQSIYSVITGTGKYIPPQVVTNKDLTDKTFYNKKGERIEKAGTEILEKFKAITTIAERRYVRDDLVASDIAYFAAKDALESAGIDGETLDYIIVAHNFGDIKHGTNRTDIVPTLAARVKYQLKIKNPNTVAYDLPFGCPGWLQAMIQADYYIKSGDAKRILVIGTDTLSRVFDPYDRDSLLYSDGAAATILEAKKSTTPIGILAHKTRSDTFIHSKMLFMGKAYHEDECNKDDIYLKMNGRKLYQYALEHVPGAIQTCLKKQNVCLGSVKKILIHQANGKMDDAILQRLYRLYGHVEMPADVMPMTVHELGNTSVATVPTLLDLILKKDMGDHEINKGDTIVLASVGAGMNINAMVYRA